ncbi:prokaryotic E2 ligase family D protein [Peribacillus asahii]|uniref:prokaryotic E2 ligase family D protein n=1 Tax=Peribacillus asahii TaxID=228899 RepID=UPI00207ACB1E|nr:prokaryotic E2 ligase family D protein [Peribacillus asahii]USK62235.1 prokaryotic E2 ligase family D protein [Peribacillus asahii]
MNNEKMVITIEENKPYQIERFKGEFSIGKRKVHVDDFMRSMVSSMDKLELLSLLMENKYEDVIESFLEESTENMDLVTSGRLFNVLLAQMEDDLITPSMFEDLLHVMFRNFKATKEQVNGEVYQKLLSLLLDSLEVRADVRVEIISRILESAAKKVENTVNQNELEDLFKSIYKKGKASWVEDYLAELVKQRPLYDGFMPKNIVYYRKMLGTEQVVIEVPKGLYDVKYGNEKYQQVGHPKMLFFFKIKKEKIADIRIACVKDTILKEDTKLFHYPFSHVYNKHNVCWSYGEYCIDSLEKLQHIPYIFLSTPNSGHYNGSTLDMFKALEGQEFDEDGLKPSEWSFMDLIEE